MRAAVLFAGIGGWEIACELNGVDVAWAAEWDDWKRERYLERWPGAALYSDVAQINGADLVERHGPIDILLGSPPCTDISAANVGGRGIDGDESRYYIEAIRLARETGARWIGFENSPRLRTRGADRVLSLLGDAGYALWPCVVEAEDAGAPHERGRSFVLGCRADAIERADALGRGVRSEPRRGGGARGPGAAESQADDPDAARIRAERLEAAVGRHAETGPVDAGSTAHADGHGQPDRAEHGREMAGCAGADGGSSVGRGEVADMHGEQRRDGAGRSDRTKVGNGRGPTPGHSASRARSEWQGVGGNAFQKLTALERAALCPWDQRGDGLAGYLSVAHGLAERLRGHGLSERAVKAEAARWRSALGDALVIPVVWAVVRSIVRVDATMRPSSFQETS